MKYDQNKQFKILRYTAAAAPWEINEGMHQQNKIKCRRLFILCSHGNREHEQ
jgi:hypothetical protein